LDSAESSRLDLVDRPLGKDCCLDSWWGYADVRGYVNKVKSVWRGVFEIPCFVFNFGIPGSCLALCRKHRRDDVGPGRRRASSLPCVM